MTYNELKIGDVYFSLGWSDKLYTEENVTEAERTIASWEAQLAKLRGLETARAEFQPQFEALLVRVAALGLSLRFGEENSNWEGSYYGGYAYSQEGLDALVAFLDRKKEEAAEEARKEAAAAAKASAEAEAAALGLPSNVTIWRRMGGMTNRGNGWVVRPDGSYRGADLDPSQGNLVWDQIMPGELVLRYKQGDRYDIAHCEAVHRPEPVTAEQLAVAKQIEEDMGASENAFDLDDRLGRLIDRRAAAIETAMTTLPDALRPTEAWSYQVLVSNNGLLVTDGRGWANYAEPFDTACEGRKAQVVYWVEAADGVLEAVAYDKWGGCNINLRWREAAAAEMPAHLDDEPAVEVPDLETAMRLLQERFTK